MKDEIILTVIIILGIIGIISTILGLLIGSFIVPIMGLVLVLIDNLLFRKYIGLHTAWNLVTLGEIEK